MIFYSLAAPVDPPVNPAVQVVLPRAEPLPGDPPAPGRSREEVRTGPVEKGAEGRVLERKGKIGNDNYGR